MNVLEIALIAGLVILMIVRRFAGEPLSAKRLLVLPAIFVIWGIYQWSSELHGQHLPTVDIALLVVEVLLGLALGAIRGLTIQVYERGGHLWYRYRWTTLVVWIASILVRMGVVAGAHLLTGARVSPSGVLVMLGVSLLGEAAVVGPRALRSGVPFAPDKRTARMAAGVGDPRR